MEDLTEEQKKRAFKEWIKHAIEMEYVGNSISLEFTARLDLLFDEIESVIDSFSNISSKAMYQALKKSIDNLIDEFEEDIISLSKEKLTEIADEEEDWFKKLSTIVPIVYTIPKTLKNQMMFMPFAEHEDYTSVGSKISERLRNSINSTLKLSYAMKSSSEQTKSRLQIKKTRESKNFATATATFTTAMSRAAENIILKSSSRYVIYLAHLDNRTCLVCGENHLQRFKVENAPVLPIHERCRCTLIDEALYSEEESPKTYSEWLLELDDDELKEVLGKSRYQMYKNGVPITSFVNDGRIIPLNELEKKSNTYD